MPFIITFFIICLCIIYLIFCFMNIAHTEMTIWYCKLTMRFGFRNVIIDAVLYCNFTVQHDISLRYSYRLRFQSKVCVQLKKCTFWTSMSHFNIWFKQYFISNHSTFYTILRTFAIFYNGKWLQIPQKWVHYEKYIFFYMSPK